MTGDKHAVLDIYGNNAAVRRDGWPIQARFWLVWGSFWAPLLNTESRVGRRVAHSSSLCLSGGSSGGLAESFDLDTSQASAKWRPQ